MSKLRTKIAKWNLIFVFTCAVYFPLPTARL